MNRAFRDWTPYPVILVELDEQRGQPTADRSLRIASNCIDADGNPEQEKNIGIGKRVETARSRSTHRRGGYRRGGRDLAECKADPSWAASITSTSGPRDILPPHAYRFILIVAKLSPWLCRQQTTPTTPIHLQRAPR